MRIFDLIQQLLPAGTDAAYLDEPLTIETLNRPGGMRSTKPNYDLCPIWPPDLFAVVGTIIERSGCYTEASPDRTLLAEHEKYIEDVLTVAICWDELLNPPVNIQKLWKDLVQLHKDVPVVELTQHKEAVKVLLTLFAIADEASSGMGWDVDPADAMLREFAYVVMENMIDPGNVGTEKLQFRLPFWPYSLCGMISPERAVVLPKSITTNKGCTIRSLSHHLALLPCQPTLEVSWMSVSRPKDTDIALRLLLIPYPLDIPNASFRLSSAKTPLNNQTTHAAFFELSQLWLRKGKDRLTGADLAKELVIPLILKATQEAGGVCPNGIVFPECALSQEVADELIAELVSTGIEFLVAGVLSYDTAEKRWLNQAKTFAIVNACDVVRREQNKHHRWRIDRAQARQYGLAFDSDLSNNQWWEDISVSLRRLPFYALRRDMSMVTLICEDLARMDPAMSAIRAVGPNLVLALLMDGPQLGARWPGRYAGVLSDEPGCAVLTLTCAAMMERSNRTFGGGRPVIAFWAQADGGKREIEFPRGSKGILLTLEAGKKHQTTLDNRSDNNLSRELSFLSAIPL